MGCRVFFRQAAVIIFKIRKPDVDAIGKLPDGFSPLIAAAVIDHGYVKLWPRQLQGLADGWEILGGRHQVDVVGALFLELQEDLSESGCGNLFSEIFMAQRIVLAENAF